MGIPVSQSLAITVPVRRVGPRIMSRGMLGLVRGYQDSVSGAESFTAKQVKDYLSWHLLELTLQGLLRWGHNPKLEYDPLLMTLDIIIP